MKGLCTTFCQQSRVLKKNKNKFLENVNLPKATQDKTENTNSPLTIIQIEFIIKKFEQELSRHMWFHFKFLQNT
jgi:hypothetical protein